MNGEQRLTLDSLFGPAIGLAIGPGGVGQCRNWRPEQAVAGLAVDSRKVAPQFVFFARPGLSSDGARYIARAVHAGACALVVPASIQLKCDADLPTLAVDDVGECLGRAADRFFAQPSRKLRVVGITGTNGKTSVAHFVAQALHRLGVRCGIVGTLGQGIFGEELAPCSHTTPDVIEVHQALAGFVDAGAGFAVMEVSSHGLDQGRVNGVRFEVVALTNLSRDHLDYHADEAAYRAAKRRLFEWPGIRAAVINADDAFGAELLAGGATPALGFGWRRPETLAAGLPRVGSRLSAELLAANAEGATVSIALAAERAQLRTGLIGRFNIENLLAALGIVVELGYPFGAALAALAGVRAPAGRMERVHAPGQGQGQGAGPTVVVDYAHTPAALAAALSSLAPFVAGRLWCVFGCGGDRDRGKRPLMGRAARAGADRVVVTSDNPRSEPPGAIIEEILADSGLAAGGPGNAVHIEPEREAAIHYAVRSAAVDDLVLIAGKGHETYQRVGDRNFAFDDRVVARAALQERGTC